MEKSILIEKLQTITHYKGIKKILAMYLINHVFVGTNQRYRKVKLLRSYGCVVGDRTTIVGPIQLDSPIEIGEDCWIGKNFKVHGNGKVVIGNRCDIAPDVTILTGSHDIGNQYRRAGKGKNLNVNICDGCWIGARVTILGTIKIETSVVVAACSCVINDIEKNKMVAGVPAKIIKELE